MILNLETFGRLSSVGQRDFEALMRMLQHKDVGEVRVDGPSMPDVRDLFVRYRGAAAPNLLKRFVRKLYGPVTKFDGHSVVPHGQTCALPAAYMACAAKASSVSLGLAGSAYRDDFAYTVDPGSFTSLMVTTEGHLKSGDFRRWLFVRRFKDFGDYKSCLSIASSQQNKHFDPRLLAQSYCSHRQWASSWIANTRGGKGHDAKFMPGLRLESHEYYYLVYLALKAACWKGLYTTDEQDAFTLDLQTPIGAADGKVVSRIRLYCTAPNTVHIRPDERQDFDAILREPYVYGRHDYEAEFT